MNAKKTGAELFVDDVSLVELSPATKRNAR